MPSARIFRPAKDASQSGLARTRQWVLEFDPSSPLETDPLMGWTSSSDMLREVRLAFETREEAIAYAERAGIAYRVEEPHRPNVRKGLSYADNFRFDRTAPWTH